MVVVYYALGIFNFKRGLVEKVYTYITVKNF